MDADQLAATAKKIPPFGWVMIAGGTFLAWRWYSGRQVPAPADPAAADTSALDSLGGTGLPSGAGTGSTDVTNTGSGSAKLSFDNNAEWESAATDVLVARGFTAGFAQTALGKALSGDPLSIPERAAVSLALALLGVGPPGGMPPLGSDPPPPTGGGGNPAPTPTPTPGKGPSVRKAAGGPVVSENTNATTGRWTWPQVIGMFYSNPPPAGAATTRAVAQLKTANIWRVYKTGPKKGQKMDGWGGWDTVAGHTTVSLPQALYW